ncbi:hypothetical protein BS78_05G098000 [Paspalum vaginatum]|nr:hypothetical protein BS78_05G098000 [Paspalum vaginatum]
MPKTDWSRRFLVDYLHDLRERGLWLVDALGWTSHGAREMRKLAARIVAHLAGDIHLAQIPGAVRCTSSLLLLLPESSAATENTGHDSSTWKGTTETWGLATDRQNCRDICSTPGLLPKLTAPLYSATLMDEIGKIHRWAKVVERSLSRRRLRREISSNERAMSNLKGILDAAGQDLLRVQAMKILTELALDVPINPSENTKETLIAGKMLVLLSTNSKTNSDYIRRASDDIIPHLTGLLGCIKNAKYHILYAKIAVELLEILCSHSRDQLSERFLKETLLPKVLSQIPTKTIKDPRTLHRGGDAVIMQISSTSNRNYSSGQANQEKTALKELQAAILSLTLVIYAMLENQNDFTDAAEKEGQVDVALVQKLKDIVEENRQPSADSLRILKLCGRIAESMMQRDHRYTEHFRNKGFDKSLSKASESMSSLERCMLFAGTDFGQKKTVRPLFFDIEKKVRQLLRT